MGILWEENTVWVFIVMTVIIGGGAAFLAGRALALTWRPVWYPIGYMLLLGGAVRFFHFSLFNGTLLSLQYYLADTAVLIAATLLGYRLKRRQQMITQYRWLYEGAGPLSWRRRDETKQAAGSANEQHNPG